MAAEECVPAEYLRRQQNRQSPSLGGPCEGINWRGLFRDTFLFLGVQHSFRLATEPATRAGLKGPFFKDYFQSVANMHGWADQDPFYVNYIGHPMQGAVSGYIWVNNDRRYSATAMGKHPDYWKSRLRAAAFMWVYSTQFEIGPLSEASIGNIQRYYPQQGYVDHAVTPAVGMLWMLGEDALDRFLVIPFERRVNNGVARLLVRGVLNPARSFSNLMRGSVPWRREDRIGVFSYRPDDPAHSVSPRGQSRAEPPPGVAPVEFTTTFNSSILSGPGRVSCQGGSGELGVRLAPAWQAILSVGACNLDGLREANQSGDGLYYFIGPRWVPRAGSRWSPYAQFLVGGAKFTVEEADEEKRKKAHERALLTNTLPDFSSFARLEESRGFAVSAGGGVDWKFNSAMALRLGSLEYRRGWFRPIWGYQVTDGWHFTTGLTLRMGTW